MPNKLFLRYPQLKSIFVIIFSVLFLDQITKVLARVYLEPVHSVSVIGNFFRLTYVENPGIAFGIRIDNKVFFTILSIVAVIVIFYYLFSLRERKGISYAFATILGGAFGNLIDRFFYGRVVDFMDFEFFNIHIPPFKFLFFNFSGYSMDRWPVFNVADMAVSLGMIMVIAIAVFDNDEQKETSTDVVPEQD